MSDVWHITNQDKKTTDIPEEENFVVLVGAWVACIYFPEPILWENVKKWCYLDELILENDRTRKALDVAVDALKYANKCIKGGCVNWETEIDKALEQITAEQKD